MTWQIYRITVFIKLETLCSQSDTLIKLYMVSNNTSFAYNNTCTMVYAEIFANLCSGMYVYTGKRMCQLSYDSG